MRAWLKDARGKLSQAAVAEKCNISQNHYSNIERGDRTPSVSTAKRLASILGIPWTAFYNDSEEGKQ